MTSLSTVSRSAFPPQPPTQQQLNLPPLGVGLFGLLFLLTLLFASTPARADWNFNNGAGAPTISQDVTGFCNLVGGCTSVSVSPAPIGQCTPTDICGPNTVLFTFTFIQYTSGGPQPYTNTVPLIASGCGTGTAPDGSSQFGCSPTNGVQSGKNTGQGNCDCTGIVSPTGNVGRGEPININSGNVFYQVTDYTTTGQNPLRVTRFYNSRASFLGLLGPQWRSTFDRYLYVGYNSSGVPTTVTVERETGQQFKFALSGSTWVADSDVDYTLTRSGSVWTLTTPDDITETYSGATLGVPVTLSSITARNGYAQTLAYATGTTKLASVTDSYGRTLTFSLNSLNQISSIVTADSTTISYGYTGRNLTSVSFPTSPVQTVTYVYGNTSFPDELTGITDENGNTFQTWTYDAYGRGLTSSQGGSLNAHLTTFTYNDTTRARTVTNANGVTDTYSFSVLQGAPKVTGISRASTSTTAAATESFGYDTNGYLNSSTDWNGNQTTFVNNSHGLPTTINEAVGSSVARTTTITYNSTFVHLPASIVTPGVTTAFTYDTSGEPLTKTLTDTTSTSVPYSTNGQARTWTYTWLNHLLASVQTPRTDVTAITSYGYDGQSTFRSVTDALGHVTNVTFAQTGGYPQKIVDPNGATRGFSWDARQRLAYDVAYTSGGNYVTYFNLDAAGELTQMYPPDGSYLSYAYDNAHRLTKVTDAYGQYSQFTLDALGNKTQTQILDPTLRYSHTATFDALGRTLTDVGGASQTTTFTYDKNGNALTVKDGLNQTTTRVFDALNRPSTSTDANSGVVTVTYDLHNRPLTVQDQNGHTTSYVYDGFGDVIQESSPDRGTTVYHYDNNGNLISKTDAASVVTNHTFDKLDRLLTTTYPADTTLNVAYTYDQTGTGFSFGIGRLTSLTDKAGSLNRAYDERGNLLTETRVNGGNTYTTSYTYNSFNRLLSTTYPDGTLVSNQYDSPGRVYIMSAKPAGASTATTIASSINHFAFGPLQYIAYGNGMTETWFFDQDYRVTGVSGNVGSITTTPVMKFQYGLDAANNVNTITDYVNAANSQTLAYDVLNRLTTATSGTGGYGSLSWGYDAGGDLLNRVSGGITYSHTYNSGTNQIAGATWPSNTEAYGYTASGNINSLVLNGTAIFTATYNKANRLDAYSGSFTAVTGTVYDAFGKRFSKSHSSGTTLYFYDQNGGLLAENTGGIYTDYAYVDRIPLAVIQPTASPSANQINYITQDRLGTPQMAFNSSGTQVWAATYQPYGQASITTSTITNSLRLPGQVYDSEVGFHYNLNRDYIPSLGRYLETDPIGLRGGANPYLYANANPGKFVDRRGLQVSGDDYPQTVDDVAQAYGPSVVMPSSNTLMHDPGHNNLEGVKPGDFLGPVGDMLDVAAVMNALAGDEPGAAALHKLAGFCKAAGQINENDPVQTGLDVAQDIIYRQLGLDDAQALATPIGKAFSHAAWPTSPTSENKDEH